LRAWRFDAVLAERHRIAREIHDSLAQDLLGVSLRIEGALGSSGATPSTTRHHLERARDLIHESLASVRRSVWNLRDPRLAAGDLGHALASVAETLAGPGGPRFELRLSGRPRVLPPEVTEPLFRIGQEAVTNAVRHARADHVLIALDFTGNRVTLRVKDDGRGFTPGQRGGRSHFGLANMAERANQLGARLEIRTAPGRGTDVEIEAPL
jgi:signal transduction histidine kinase